MPQSEIGKLKGKNGTSCEDLTLKKHMSWPLLCLCRVTDEMIISRTNCAPWIHKCTSQCGTPRLDNVQIWMFFISTAWLLFNIYIFVFCILFIYIVSNLQICPTVWYPRKAVFLDSCSNQMYQQNQNKSFCPM